MPLFLYSLADFLKQIVFSAFIQRGEFSFFSCRSLAFSSCVLFLELVTATLSSSASRAGAGYGVRTGTDLSPRGLEGAAAPRAHLATIWQLAPHEALYGRPAGPSRGTRPRKPAVGSPQEKGRCRGTRPHSGPTKPKISQKQLSRSSARNPAGPPSGRYFKSIQQSHIS